MGADEGCTDGRALGDELGCALGPAEGCAVGCVDGTALGASEGRTLGPAVGCRLGVAEGWALGCVEGKLVGPCVGAVDGRADGAFVGTPVGAAAQNTYMSSAHRGKERDSRVLAWGFAAVDSVLLGQMAGLIRREDSSDA